tara:strand:+ start:322 stop:684 length:363 start_codon:yes stop_codon:yes gene_type:complete
LNKYFLNLWQSLFAIFFCISLYLFFANFPEKSDSIQHLDKLLHFLIFSFLTFFLLKSIKNIQLGVYFCVLYAAITEIIQSFLPYRKGDLYDLLFDLFGIFLVLFVFFPLKKKSENINNKN